MMPILFTIADYPVYAYTLATALSYVLGIGIVAALSHRDGRSGREITDVLVVMTCAALFGSKLFHVLFEARGHLLSDGSTALGILDLLREDPWHWMRFFDPGYVFYGGLITAMLATWVFLRIQKIRDPLAYGDYVAWSLALGICLGRIGCFLGGCCYGIPAEQIAWAVSYPDGPLADLGPLHPTQLYDAAFGALALSALVYYYPGKRFHGQTFFCFLMGYACWRLISECFRGDFERGYTLAGLSTSQAFSLVILGASVFFYFRANRHAKTRSSLDNCAQI